MAEVDTLTCIGGHTWERPRRTRGAVPIACPEHEKYVYTDLPIRLQPPKKVLAEWEVAATNLGTRVPEYLAYWKKKWNQVTRTLSARCDGFRFVDPAGIEEYIRHIRLEELHRTYAERNPYFESPTTNMVRQHPGWERAQIEAREARRCAERIGLVDRAQAERPDDEGGGEQNGGGADGTSEGLIDDLVGPDGSPL